MSLKIIDFDITILEFCDRLGLFAVPGAVLLCKTYPQLDKLAL
ncbi:MAG: hypothetical protein QNJ32_19985 [Xenococcaceae cyanobacterium MO_167.B27]|nr:hypothetical protein [Xenococcaceae cyanobacterium MO_167.B27]